MEVTFRVGEKFPEISGDSADQFAEEMLRLEDSDFEEVVLDFEGTEYINSMAMGTIFATYQKLSGEERSLKIMNVNDKIYRLLKMANLVDLLGVKG
ncbi:MAG: STAS domain-containing protein [Planctomycetota bacterium]|jgi:anti-anti-sigma factor